MASIPVLNPEIPYVGVVEDGLVSGKMVKVKGRAPPQAVRFAINYQLGPTLNPRDDIAIHVSPRFPEGIITRNHIESMNWGPEENDGPMVIQPGQDFEILILCEPVCFKIAINGRHYAEFKHRLPYNKITHLVIDGDVEIHSITYEIIQVAPARSPVPDVPTANYGPPAPGGIYPNLGPQGPQGPPPPDQYGGPGGYNPPRGYGYQPGYEKPEEEDAFGGCLDKVGLALGGLVAAGGAAALAHAMTKKKDEEKEHEKTDASKSHTESESGLNLGALGAALASSLASNALHGNNQYPQQGYPPQESGGGVLGSILGALGSGTQQPHGGYQQPPSSDPLGGMVGSLLSNVLGGGGGSHQPPPYQPTGGYGGYSQPNYPPQGGYGGQSQGSDLLSGIGSAIGSSLLSSAFDGFGKNKDKPHGESSPQPQYHGPQHSPLPTHRSPQSPSEDRASSGGGSKLTAAEISKGLGLSDDED